MQEVAVEQDKSTTEFIHVILLFYVVLSCVLLLNMLIGILGSTFDRVKDNCDLEWKYAYSHLLKVRKCQIYALSPFEDRCKKISPLNLAANMKIIELDTYDFAKFALRVLSPMQKETANTTLQTQKNTQFQKYSQAQPLIFPLFFWFPFFVWFRWRLEKEQRDKEENEVEITELEGNDRLVAQICERLDLVRVT